MITLFNIPSFKIDTSRFSNLLHDKIVRQFEENFAEYVGAKYAVSLNSATNAIFLCLDQYMSQKVVVPSLIPPVVCNSILNARMLLGFCDNTSWVGDSYVLHQLDEYKIIDSAQKVNRNQFKDEANDNDLMIFSFYPTKPVGSCDGGMVVSNDMKKIDFLRELSFNGMTFAENNWDRKQVGVGYKYYMNSIQAYIANENLSVLEDKKEKLAAVREMYNAEFGLNNTSDHLYRISVSDNQQFIEKAKQEGIQCGIHYHPAHLCPVFNLTETALPLSEKEGVQTGSIPFHEKLGIKEITKVITFVHANQEAPFFP